MSHSYSKYGKLSENICLNAALLIEKYIFKIEKKQKNIKQRIEARATHKPHKIYVVEVLEVTAAVGESIKNSTTISSSGQDPLLVLEWVALTVVTKSGEIINALKDWWLEVK